MSFIAAILSAALLVAPSPQAVQEKERGDRLAANGDLAGAMEAYQNAAKLAPGYAAPLNELGILSVNQGRNEEAVAQFRAAVAADPNFGLALNNLGFVLRKMGRFSEALEAYQRYVALEPTDAAGLYGLAEAYKGIGDKPNALNAYERYLAADQDAKNQKRRERAQATAEQLRRELGAAAPAPVQAPAFDAGAGVAGAGLGVAGALGSVAAVGAAPEAGGAASGAAASPLSAASGATPLPNGASAAAPTPVKAPPEKVEVAKQRLTEALQLRGQGKMRDSLFALQDAVNADAQNVQAMAELGIAYAILGYYPQAIERWQRVLAMTEDEATRASAIQNIDRARQKLTAQEKAPAGAKPAAPGANTYAAEAQQAYTRGVELYTAQKYAEALQQFDRAIQVRADFVQAFAARGSAHFAMGNYTRALGDYAQAMKLDSGLASPVFGVAETLLALGKKADALPYYKAYASSQAPDVQPNLQQIARQRLAEAGPR